MSNADEHLGCDAHDHPAHEHEFVPDWVLSRGAAMFKAMGDPARLRLLETLMQGPHCVSELAAETDDNMSTVSQRLAKLLNGGLVRRERVGKHVFYELADDHIVELVTNALAHAAEEHDH